TTVQDLGDIAAEPLIDREKVRAVIDRPETDGGPAGGRAALEGLLQFNAWLERYHVRVNL
ncbi:hypothetical protein ACWCSH_07605, partial [Streptosporangium sp. NPDC001682]